MTTVDDLPALWEELQAAAAELELPIFPNVPRSASGSVRWPDADCRAFLATAAEAAARIIYVAAEEWSANDVDRVEADLRDDDDELGDEERTVLAMARRHVGDLSAVHAAFVIEGVLHHFHATPHWLEEIEEQIAMAGIVRGASAELEAAQEDAEWAALEANEQAWVRTLAEDRRFWKARNEHERRQAARQIIPELAECLRGSDRERLSFGLRVLRAATTEARDVIQPRVVEELRARLPDLVQTFRQSPGHQLRASKERTAAARRFLADQAGFAVPELVGEFVLLVGPPGT